MSRHALYDCDVLHTPFFWEDQIQKEFGNGDTCTDAQVTFAKIEGRLCLHCTLEKKPNTQTKACVLGHHLLDNLLRPPQTSQRAQLTALVKPGSKSRFFSLFPCNFIVVLRMWPESLAW